MRSSCSIIADQLGVTFSGNAPTLEAVDLRCEPGSFVTIVGPSGCGKSTFLRCVANLQPPTSGTLQLAEAQDQTPQVAFVFQDPTLLPWRNVQQNIELPLELRRDSTVDGRSQAMSALRQVGLVEDDARKFPHMLSGGMRMRVSLARALITRPGVLLLDEPFAALDEISRQQLNEELLRLWQEQAWTTLFVTHNVNEAVFLSQRVLVMSQRPGKIAADFSIEFDRPRDAELRSSLEFAELTGRVSAALREVAA
ncbi:MAG: ABC transporter ATP-binding protein [Planctomycetaceae bacterium]|nr:ABC transporter ATP-binding protein [Planctomycetaceae bacterium]